MICNRRATLLGWTLLTLISTHVLVEAAEKSPSISLRYGYLLVIPKTLTSGTNQKTCLSVHNVPEGVEVNFTVRLHNSKDTFNYDIHYATMSSESAQDCFPLSVPTVNDNKMKLAAITVETQDTTGFEPKLSNFENGAGITVSESSMKKLVIVQPEFDIYINTDKQIYKPGQEVLFRILQLRGLHPDDKEINKITIVDPKDRKLMVYDNLKPTLGLVSERFQLVAEPTLGEWIIKVECAGKKYQTTFKVEEYVLPKFEVKIEVPKYLHVEAEDFDIKICAKYTYGKPVRGKAVIDIRTEHPWSSSGAARPSQHLLSQTDETGCTVVQGSPSVMLFKNRDLDFQGLYLVVTAEITEDGTGVTLSGKNKECSLSMTPYKLKLHNEDSNFKAGLPWYTAVTYSDIAGAPVANKELVVEVRTSLINSTDDQLSFINMTTNQDGMITLVIDTSADASYYNLMIYDPSLPIRDYRWWNDASREMRIFRDTSYIRLGRTFSPSFSFLVIHPIPSVELPMQCPNQYRLTGETIVTYISEDDVEEPEIFCQVTSGSNIVYDGRGVVTNSECEDEEMEDEIAASVKVVCKYGYQVDVAVKQEWMPEAKIMVYLVKKDGEVVPDDITVSIADCFSNTASIEFDSDSVRPGHNVDLTLSAEPDSLCALSVVDKSTHLLGGDHSLTSGKITSQIKSNRMRDDVGYFQSGDCYFHSSFAYRYTVDDDDIITDKYPRYNNRRKRSTESTNILNRKRRFSQPFFHHGSEDASASFKNLGLLFFSNLGIHLLNCNDYYMPIAYAMDINEAAGPPESRTLNKGADRLERTIKVRNYFPETWKWDLVKIGDDGKTTLPAQVMPDTITEWIATTYCISQESGVGVSKAATVKGFKPVFLSMTLPYSIIRGEEITIKASLFNYLSSDTCLEMVISLDKTEDFEISGDGEHVFTRCLCGGNVETLAIDIQPIKLGEITFTMKTWSRDGHVCGKEVKAVREATDGVERKILVEAEGEEVEITTTDFLCLDEGSNKTSALQRSIEIPENSYEGSEKVIVKVLGSVMGPAMDNLDHLIKVPYGCGEQNMVTMVPNIVALKYLLATENLTPAKKEQIEKNILLGYQRQLNYQRKDGSFSAFGENDSSGSTWLTAFVISTFTEASEFIFVDEDIVNKAVAFISENTEEGGCVKKVGLVHNKRMMGGADGKNSLNAYVSLALYKSGRLGEGEGPSPADITGCDPGHDMKLYTRALLFYTNTLKGNQEAARTLWSALKSNATLSGANSFEEAEKIFWSDQAPVEEEETNNWWYYQKPSDAVELTGYVLMGYLKLENAFPEEFPIAEAYPIVQWLTSQRNAYGGWSSTQNTIIGLSALAAYASRTYIPNTSLTVVARAEGSDVASSFDITSQNSLVTQQSLITPVPAMMTYTSSGVGCALIQTNVKYNVPRKEPEPSFTVTTFTRGLAMGCAEPGTRLLIVCATYAGTSEQPVSNMAVFEIKMVTGYNAVSDSLKKMSENNKFNGLKRYELDGKKVIVYFRAIGSQPKCAAFEVSHDEEIKNVQPGNVRVYDYYDPDKEASAFYDFSCKEETYDPATHVHDCMIWNKKGHCDTACVTDRDSSTGLCHLRVSPPSPRDYCKIYGDRGCGDTGRCMVTRNYYRCACNEGYKQHPYWRNCIPEDEEVDTLVPILPEPIIPILLAPNCTDPCPRRQALQMSEGNETIHFCDVGFELDENDNTYCVDIDECAVDACDGDNVVCTNSVGNYECVCEEGYAPYIDVDENVLELSRCIAIADDSGDEEDESDGPPPPPATLELREIFLPLTPEIRIVEVAPVALPMEDERISCPVCLSSFPKPSEYRSVFCPKMNAFVVTNTSSHETMALRAIVANGKAMYGDQIKNVKLTMEEGCVCDNLNEKKSILLTSHDIITDDEGKYIELDRATITNKRAWRKVQKFSCEENKTPEPTEEFNGEGPDENNKTPEATAEVNGEEPDVPPVPFAEEGVIEPELVNVENSEAEVNDEPPKI